MKYVQGEILTIDGFVKGYLGYDHHTIQEMGKGSSPQKAVATGLIVPTFVNAHTHIGDSFVRKKHLDLPRNVEALVAPPDGLKHRLLRTATEHEIIEGMKESIQSMRNTGTTLFCDFREDGFAGIQQLRTALQQSRINAVVFSRPKELVYERDEIRLLLENSEGVGISSISDWEYEELKKISHEVKRKNKLFALHGSEVVHEDIDSILDLKPDLLVHMIQATTSDLIRVKENDIPLILCPRSNSFFNLKPNFSLIKQSGVQLLIGTDNAMLHTPNILEEIRYINGSTREFSVIDLLMMITYTPRKVLNQDADILVPNSPSSFIVLDRGSLEPLYIST